MPTEENNPVTPRRLIPVTQWPRYHSWPPIGGLRHLIFHAKVNGFDACITRAGRRVLVDEAKFFAWIDSQKEQEAAR